jgi:hypothetical protein
MFEFFVKKDATAQKNSGATSPIYMDVFNIQ